MTIKTNVSIDADYSFYVRYVFSYFFLSFFVDFRVMVSNPDTGETTRARACRRGRKCLCASLAAHAYPRTRCATKHWKDVKQGERGPGTSREGP